MKKVNISAKFLAWSIILTIIPVLGVGAVSYLGTLSLKEQITQSRQTTLNKQDTQQAVERQLSFIAIGSGTLGLVSAAIAAGITYRLLRPIIRAAQTSTTLANRLRQSVDNLETPDNHNDSSPKHIPDKLTNLESNLNLIAEHLPDLLWKKEATQEPFQVLMTISRHLWESFSEENVLRTTVEEVRQAVKTDRVVIFRFDVDGEGTFIAESVAPIWPKTLWATIHDPDLAKNYPQIYQQDRIQVVNNIYQAGLSDEHIGLLERFAVKATLVAPIIRNNQLFGLLMAHECSNSRIWQDSEIDLLAQIAAQVGFALDHARLVEQVDTAAEQAQVFTDITLRLRETLREEDILKITVEEVRKALRTDRVIVYSFDSDWYGTVVAESVVPGFAKALWAKIKDPCFVEGYVELYQSGRVQATDNIYEAGLTECHLQQLEPFGVKANLVASILKDDKLFGLLIAHQCSSPRHWQQPEIDLFAQIAAQTGFALDHAKLLQRINATAEQTQLFTDITLRLRESLREEDILSITVEEVRRAIRTDRVIIYSFDSDWYGTVVAESVVPGFAKALWAKIKDPCFAEGYVELYQSGRVQATDNIYEAGLTECHLQQLEPFGVKANLVAPILKDDKLFGLLIAHECSSPRHWQELEIDLLTQIARQVGFALDHARLLAEVDKAYQTAELVLRQQSQQQQALQRQVSKTIGGSQTALQHLSTEALSQIESVSATYNQIRASVDTVADINTIVQQAERQQQQATEIVQSSSHSIDQLLNNISTIQNTLIETSEKLISLDKPARKLSEIISLITNLVSQVKLQTLSAELEATRIGESGQELTAITKKANSLARQLETELTGMIPLITEIQGKSYEISTDIKIEFKQLNIDSQLIEEIRFLSHQMTHINEQVSQLIEKISQGVMNGVEISDLVSESVLELEKFIRQTSHQSIILAESFNNLTQATQSEG